MSVIDQLFTDLRAAGRKALMPFVTAGDPDLDFTSAVIQELAGRGCSLCEVGVPYSDPIADGPVIQASYTRALERDIKLHDVFQSLTGLRGNLTMPLVTMVSYAIVYRIGLERYVAEAQQAGVAGAIVPDLPVEESAQLADLCRREDFSLIQLITPTTPRSRATRIAAQSSGFLYYVSVTGITGERRELPPELIDSVCWLKEQTDLPVCIGFGISTREHVRLLSPVADGLIVGSAIVRRIAAAGQDSSADLRQHVVQDVGQFAESLLTELN